VHQLGATGEQAVALYTGSDPEWLCVGKQVPIAGSCYHLWHGESSRHGGLHCGAHRFQPSAQRSFHSATASSRLSRARRCSKGGAPLGSTCPLVTSRLCCHRSHTSGLKCSTRRPSLNQPSAGQAGTLASRLSTCTASAHLRCPAPLASHVVGPALAAANQVLTLGNQALVQLAGEQWDALGPGVVPEPVAVHADLAAAAGAQHVLIEIGPDLAVALCHRRP